MEGLFEEEEKSQEEELQSISRVIRETRKNLISLDNEIDVLRREKGVDSEEYILQKLGAKKQLQDDFPDKLTYALRNVNPHLREAIIDEIILVSGWGCNSKKLLLAMVAESLINRPEMRI